MSYVSAVSAFVEIPASCLEHDGWGPDHHPQSVPLPAAFSPVEGCFSEVGAGSCVSHEAKSFSVLLVFSPEERQLLGALEELCHNQSAAPVLSSSSEGRG